jgi:hypothetical protein
MSSGHTSSSCSSGSILGRYGGTGGSVTIVLDVDQDGA